MANKTAQRIAELKADVEREQREIADNYIPAIATLTGERDRYLDVINRVLAAVREHRSSHGGDVVPTGAVLAAVYVSEPQLVEEDVVRGSVIEHYLHREDDK